MAVPQTRREKCEIILAGMSADRKPYEADWQEIIRLALPARGLILNDSNGRATRRANTASYDSHGARAARTLTAGMHSGLSNQATPWFKLVTGDRDLMEFQPVKEYLAIVERAIYDLFSSTNFYDAIKVGYSELGTIGVEACVAVEHSDYRMVSHPLTAGEYWLGTDHGLRVDRLYRRSLLTVAQCVGAFPWDKLSKTVQNFYTKSNYQALVPIMYAIEPNDSRDPDRQDAPNKAWRSIAWEVGQSDKSVLLRESGFDSKPFWAPRWETTSHETYSSASPGFVALPDLRELQLTARRRGRAMDMLVRPPIAAPNSVSGQRLRLDPGSVNFLAAQDVDKVKSVFDIGYQTIQAVRDDVMAKRQDVDESFHVDLFMAISQMEGVQPRNDLELSLRENEKFTQLGPVVDRVNIEKLEVAIDRAYNILVSRNELPPVPKELEGKPLTVDFVSMLAQAQKAAANTAIERAARFVGFIAGIFPDAAMKFDAEQAIDDFSAGTGVPPKIIRSDEVVEKMRAQAAVAQQQQQMAEMAQPMRDGAQAAELLSRTNVGGGQNMLQQMMGA